MGEIAIKIVWALVSKLMTEVFVSRMLVYGLDAIAEKTTNKVDDNMVKAVADALGVKKPE